MKLGPDGRKERGRVVEVFAKPVMTTGWGGDVASDVAEMKEKKVQITYHF
jgi:hypothetical protein